MKTDRRHHGTWAKHCLLPVKEKVLAMGVGECVSMCVCTERPEVIVRSLLWWLSILSFELGLLLSLELVDLDGLSPRTLLSLPPRHWDDTYLSRCLALYMPVQQALNLLSHLLVPCGFRTWTPQDSRIWTEVSLAESFVP